MIFIEKKNIDLYPKTYRRRHYFYSSSTQLIINKYLYFYTVRILIIYTIFLAPTHVPRFSYLKLLNMISIEMINIDLYSKRRTSHDIIFMVVVLYSFLTSFKGKKHAWGFKITIYFLSARLICHYIHYVYNTHV